MRHIRLEDYVGDGGQVHAGIFRGSVSIVREDSFGDQALDSDLHRVPVGELRLYVPMDDQSLRRVFAVAPMPPEKIAYALARYSRSPDSIRDSIEWVRTHDSSKFLESFYFQYGHASIADLGHLVLCLEGISELAATEAEDEQLWDGQARSSRYQNFSRTGFIVPPEFGENDAAMYRAGAEKLLQAYTRIHERTVEHLKETLPRPADMRSDAYERNIAARAFDVARYCLFFGIPTGVGQVVSIRTLERQIQRLRASEYREVVELGEEMTRACGEPPSCGLPGSAVEEPLAPTLARHVQPDFGHAQTRSDLKAWAKQNLSAQDGSSTDDVDLVRPQDPLRDIAATLLYPVTDRTYRSLYETACGWSAAICREVLEVALRSRGAHHELPRAFRTQTYVFDIVMDIGAYRDLHRHRRCQQLRQEYGTALGWQTPEMVLDAGLGEEYRTAMEQAHRTVAALPAPGSHYLLPFATRARFLFKMDLAETEYIARLRSGVRGDLRCGGIAGGW
jgi:thymidylate synthase ThyX